MIRNSLSKTQAAELVLELFPGLSHDPFELKDLTNDLRAAWQASTLSLAAAITAHMGPTVVLEIHRRYPWTPSPDEAMILRAFAPNYLRASMCTAESGADFEQLMAHTEKMCEELYDRSVRELEAERPGA